MADAGLPIEHVADQLGHKDLRMLQEPTLKAPES
jgi:hypothetical protein